MRAILDRQTLVVVVMALCFGGRLAHCAGQFHVGGLDDGYGMGSDLIAAAFESRDTGPDHQTVFSTDDADSTDELGLVVQMSSELLKTDFWDLMGSDVMSEPAAPALQDETVKSLEGKHGLLLDSGVSGDVITNNVSLFTRSETGRNRAWVADSFEVDVDPAVSNPAWILVPSGITLGLMGIGLFGWLYIRREHWGDGLQSPLLMNVEALSGTTDTAEASPPTDADADTTGPLTGDVG